MKRYIFILGAVVALVSTLWGMPRVARADSGMQDYAVGGGFRNSPNGVPLHFAFSAHDTSPNPPTGHAVVWTDISSGKIMVSGDVNCLNVNGNEADIGFVVTKSNVFPVNDEAVFSVIDNGPPVNGTSPDMMSLVHAQPPGANCPPETDFQTIQSGNILVHDPILAVLPCPALTDNTTYRIDTDCSVYFNDGSGWQPAP